MNALVCIRAPRHPGTCQFRRSGTPTLGCPRTRDIEALEALDPQWDGTCRGCEVTPVPALDVLCRDCEITQVRLSETHRKPAWAGYAGHHVYIMA